MQTYSKSTIISTCKNSNKYDNYDCPTKYMKVAEQIIKKANKINETGGNFAIWGTCLGFEVMVIVFSDYDFYFKQTNSLNHSLNTIIINSSKINFFNNNIKNSIQSEYLLYYNHRHAVDYYQFLNNDNLNSNFDIIGISNFNKIDMVTMIKHKKYPYFAVQFHPEKILYENKEKLKIVKTINAVEISLNFSTIFRELIKGNNKLTREEIDNNLIDNYIPVKFSGGFDELYYFKK